MRLLELEIHNVRGIRDLVIKPGGNNLVIYGPNGSGKSAVVDAIDFLLTGEMSRLTGPGTAGITLRKHGPHIDGEAKDSEVAATIMLPDVAEPVRLKRCIAQPKVVQCDEGAEMHVQWLESLAHRGQHMLTRRDILRFVAAEAGTRAREIQEVLNISEVEAIRKALVTARGDLAKETELAARAVEKAKGAVIATTGDKAFDASVVLEHVNKHRETLGGGPVERATDAELKRDLAAPSTASAAPQVSLKLVQRDLQNLREVVDEEEKSRTAQAHDELVSSLEALRSSPESIRALAVLELTQLGMELIDESGSCPLCDTPWPPGKLLEHLEQRAEVAESAGKDQKHITDLAQNLLSKVDKLTATLTTLIKVLEPLGVQKELDRLQSWSGDLEQLSDVLTSPVEKYPDDRFNRECVAAMLSPDDLAECLDRVGAVVLESYPETSPQQSAWDALTKLGENLKRLEGEEAELRATARSYRRVEKLLESFLAARDEILGGLYDHVRDRFVQLYKEIHGQDEEGFSAVIEPHEAALEFDVDFYGRGVYPPHALHSEGHQDSMGLCLYLALAEHLTKGLIDLIVLDDVVMSVDSDHRRGVCDVLARAFADRQLLITTHDKTWARELCAGGVVDSRGMIEFYNWHVDTGPVVGCEQDMWHRLEEDLDTNQIASAAGRLRRDSEHFFSMACDALKAPVRYRLDGRLELGDFLPAAMGQFRRLLRQAKQAAQSWGDQEAFEALIEEDSIASQVYTRTNAEQWALNANVHYNNWANFSANDFRPVVEAFRDLCGLFVCSKCEAMLGTAEKGHTPVAVRCSCGNVNWNLEKRGAA